MRPAPREPVKPEPLERRHHPPDELDPRARQILRAVVQEYTETGEPVPSSSLAGQPGIALSSASVRAVLADLEALGYLEKPHTSAGRIPTDKGYRFYVDVLVRLRALGTRERELIDRRYDPHRGIDPPDRLVADASRLLHALTRWAGVASTPREDETFRTLEFVRLREDRVLAVCVTRSGAVRNRLLHLETSLGQEDLDRASRCLQSVLGEGRTLGEARAALARELESDRARYDQLLHQALELGARALADSPEVDERAPGQAPGPLVLLEGETSLIAEPTLADNVQDLRALFRALEEKARLAHLLERTAEARELTLFIGEETGLGPGAGLAVVAMPYARGGEVLGAVGVIGPARMAYGRVIPVVEYTAQALSRSLEES